MVRETARHMHIAAKDARKELETAVKLIEQNLDASALTDDWPVLAKLPKVRELVPPLNSVRYGGLAGAAACDLVECGAELVADACGYVGVWLVPSHVRFAEYAGGLGILELAPAAK